MSDNTIDLTDRMVIVAGAAGGGIGTAVTALFLRDKSFRAALTR